jgi:hypothetical protein
MNWRRVPLGNFSHSGQLLGFGSSNFCWFNSSVPERGRIPVKKQRASYQQKDGKQGARALHGDKLSGKAYNF